MHHKFGLKLTSSYSNNFSTPKRSKSRIKFIIIHYTGMKKESASIRRLKDPKSKVSSHYYIKKNGDLLNLVPDLYEAWHAGKSNWKNFRLLNKNSIGIEITNPGHENGYRNFSNKQILSLKKLLKYLMKKYKIGYKFILGHSDISPNRKKDPGEKFPWEFLSKNKLAQWHGLSRDKLIRNRNQSLTIKEEKEFLVNLYKLGYSKIENIKIKQNNRFLTKSFQRRFRQDLVNGIVDKECLLIIRDLASKR